MADPLFKGLTRPALFFGMPYAFAMVGFGGSMAIHVKLHSYEFLFTAIVVVILLGRHLGTKNQHFLAISNVRGKYLSKMPKSFKHWGGRTYRHD